MAKVKRRNILDKGRIGNGQRQCLARVSATEYRLTLAGRARRAVAWLRGLSDGYVLFDDSDHPRQAAGTGQP